ncbi:envelope stress response membrane protein PspB [Paraneptunicella aestuarii]|uniref:envelope stress response membrane protein PspB n=1 Tax=Paraneptunicella aestuarii TaxID=2831148 RepID=UPI001E53FBF1|nr:envelope stress response membrane protein PspB [Paraneptunicella aestuarii]UAA37787.1 envelope stress response membrane protein PspB [Paraneptunicella aestuarii]
MEELIGLIVAPIIVFLVIVAPIWLVLHYRSKRQISQGLSEEQVRSLNELAQTAEQMAERIQTLEAILDAETPEWRKKV